jgi:hypothetical protein
MLKSILFAIAAAGLICSAAQASSVMVIHHEVANYSTWRPVFDADAPNQQAAGLSNPHVYQSVDDPNNVTIVFDVADPAKAKMFSASKALKDTMTKAGVTGKPVSYILNPAP